MYREQNHSWFSNVSANNSAEDIFISGSMYKFGLIINNYYLWVIFVVGFPGNLATLVTICRMRHLKIHFVMYVALLAIADNLAISVKILYYQLFLNKVPIGSAGCGLLEFLGNFLLALSSWILVLMAIERLVAVRYPFKVHFLSGMSNKNTALAVFVAGLIIAGVCVPILWVSTFKKNGECFKENTKLLKVLQWTITSAHAFLPFVILTVCNFLIALEIRTSFRLRNMFRSINKVTFNRRICDIQRQSLIMLFTSTIMFCLLNFPICVFLLTNHYWVAEENSFPYAAKYLCKQLVFLLSDSNHAVNFYLYFLSSRKFRSQFNQMITSLSKLCGCSK